MQEHRHTGPVDRLTWTFSRIAMWGPAFIVSIIFYEVFMRYVLSKPTLWVNEMSLWVGGMIYVTAGLYAMQQRSHIRIFVIYDLAPLWLRRVFDIISTLCVVIFAIAVVWGGFGEALAKFWRWEAFGTAWDPPIPATNKPLILLTVVVLAMQATSNLIRDWPASKLVRRIFDIACTLGVIALSVMALPALFSATDGDGMLKAPLHWRVFLSCLIVFSVGLMVYGLVKDFNDEPQTLDEFEEDHGIPDQVLSGNPPPVDSAAGRVAAKDNAG
ncbi:TRAP transporter small permease subunit [Ahrensia sp. R2A130]|uniref:TRAP transporter small permease subunit n=1 Tax=Ahrensia sp. R2A130 TaxID=744979 RepID=UPI0001E0D129|nr:TRAP transporter small permease [Ahrensia sp. R2A130]EFL87899.1 trap dicarboxylate transporter, dctq subunit [Ahrensia sp. R2A130]